MKQTFAFSLTLTLAVVLLLPQRNILAQVSGIVVKLQQPPPNQLRVEHLWKVTLVNPTRTTYRVKLLARVTEASEGLILEGTTAAFALPPGTKVVGRRDLTPLDIEESHPKYADVVKNIGGVPTGDYEICLTAINADNGLELGGQCLPAQVQNLTQVELLEPGSGTIFVRGAQPIIVSNRKELTTPMDGEVSGITSQEEIENSEHVRWADFISKITRKKKDKDWDEAVGDLRKKKDKDWDEAVGDLKKKKDYDWDEAVGDLKKKKDKDWDEAVGDLRKKKDYDWDEAVGDFRIKIDNDDDRYIAEIKKIVDKYFDQDVGDKPLNTGEYNPNVIFSWLPPTPIPPGARITYRLRIAEIFGNQSPYDAMRSNPAFFENRNVTSTIYRYPTASRPFASGKRYAWKVEVYLNNGFISESEIWDFGFAGNGIGRTKRNLARDNFAPRLSEHQHELKNDRPIMLASLGSLPELLLIPERTEGQESSEGSPLRFSGNVRFNATSASRVASFSEQPRNQWTADLNPVLTFYGLPFTASFLLSSQQEGNRQSINTFGFNFDIDSYKEQLKSRLENKITELATGWEKLLLGVNAFGIGTNYPSYSDYTLNDVPVTGINVELNPGIFYAAFAASTNQKGIDDVSYRRNLYAGRLGLGKKDGTHLYFTGLYAKDDEGSISLDPANSTLTPKANYVFGTEAKLSLFGDNLSLQGEGALAVITRDTRDPELEHESIPGSLKKLIDPRISTSFDYSYSGKLAFNNDASATRVSLGIKMVGPGYTSLGAPNLRTDQFGYEAKLDQRLFKRGISVGGFFKQYKDNLIMWKRSTTTTTAYGMNLGFNFPRIPFLRLSYSPHSQKNDDLNPLRKVNNSTSIYSVMTGYSYRLGNLNSATSFTFSGQETKTVSGVSDNRTNSFMVTEAVSLAIPISFTASWGLIQTTYGSGVSASSAAGPTQTTSAVSDSRINNIDLGASAQILDGWSSMAGVNIAVEKDRNRKTGFYVSSNASPFQWIGIDLRAERNVYTEQQAALGDYREFIFSATLTAKW